MGYNYPAISAYKLLRIQEGLSTQSTLLPSNNPMTISSRTAYTWMKQDPLDPAVQPSDVSSNAITWYRQQDYLESTFTLCSLINPGIPDSICSVHITPCDDSLHNITIDTIRATLRELRFDHPSIALRRAWRIGAAAQQGAPSPKDALFVYDVPRSERDTEEWLSSVVFHHDELAASLRGNIDAATHSVIYDIGKRPDSPRPLFSIHYIPSLTSGGPHCLVFHLSHSVFDSIGAWQVMDLFIAKLATVLAKNGVTRPLQWGEEVVRLPEPFAEAARVPWYAPKIAEDMAMVGRERQAVDSLKNAYGLPILHPNAKGTATGFIIHHLPSDVVTSLRTLAHKHGCSIFSLFWSAMSIAMIRVNPPNEARAHDDLSNTCTIIPTNLRHITTEDPYDKSQWKVRLSIGTNPFVAGGLERFVRNGEQLGDKELLVEDIWTLAREIAQQLEDNRKHDERAAVWGEDVVGVALAAGKEGAESQHVNVPPTGVPMLSSVGVLDPYLAETHPIPTGGSLTVSNPRTTVAFHEVFHGLMMAFHPFTWKGKMTITFAWPEAAYGTEEEQRRALAEEKSIEKVNEAVVVQFVEEFMNILDVVARSG